MIEEKFKHRYETITFRMLEDENWVKPFSFHNTHPVVAVNVTRNDFWEAFIHYTIKLN